jgi:hypothetical protein
MRLLALFMLVFPLAVRAEDDRLDKIRVLLLPLRTNGLQNLKSRGATPALTTVKHLLRDWVETRLAGLQWNGVGWNPDPIVLQEQLNDELNRAELICNAQSKISCPEQSRLGFLGPITLDMRRESILIVRTAVGIQVCGDDDSAYAYQSAEHQWHRFWQSEQNDYEEGKYFPQRLRDVLISPADFRPDRNPTEHLILTLGVEPWCTSNWHDVYYRVWRTKGHDVEPELLLTGSDWAFVESIHGSVGTAGVFTEYTAGNGVVEPDRPEIRHYVLEKGRLVRVDPVALTSASFTAFWLAHPWPEISNWTAQSNSSKLKEWLRQNKAPFGEFAYPTLHCENRPDLWQVSTVGGGNGKPNVYFLVRWRPPYHFAMVSASDRPWPGCKEEDPEADEPRSLFEILNW